MKNNRRHIKKIFPYILTALLTTITLFIMLYILKIYPFGDKAFLWADGDQYLGIESYYSTILGKNDLFYSWGNVLGGNALVELGYYAFSPFNIFFVIFRKHLIFAAHFIVYLKIIVSSTTFLYCLLSIFNDDNIIIKQILSVCYALMGYMVFYGWNVSWMDGVILLPIMYVGIKKIIDGRNAVQYIFALSIAVIANFYIGFMLCIGSFIFYIMLLLLDGNMFTDNIKRTFPQYIVSSFISVGLSAFMLIPNYLALPSNRSLSIIDMFDNMKLNISPSDILSGLFSGQVNSLDNNAPIIYVSVFVLVLDILFFINNREPIKKRLVYFTAILVMCFSFENSFINQIWHGLSNNAWFNYRYSFILSFILLVIACETVETLNGVIQSKEIIIKCMLLFGIIVAIVLQNSPDKINMKGMLYDIIEIVILALLVSSKSRIFGKKIFSVVIPLVVSFSLICNGYFYLKDTGMQSISVYAKNKSMIQKAESVINDDSFYRMDKSFTQGRCDGNLFNYNGASNYASTENLSNLDFVKKLGFSHTWMWALYNTNLPIATESLLGFKYILSDTINSKDYRILGFDGDIKYLKNQYALPVIFPVNDIKNFDLNNINDFELINEIWKSINGLDDNVMEPCTVYYYPENNLNTLDITVNNTGSLYLYLPGGTYNSLKAEWDGGYKEIKYDEYSEIYYIGEFDSGSSLKVTFTIDNENFDINNIVCYTENKKAINDNTSLVNNKNSIIINEKSSSHLLVKYSGDKRTITTTIPYDKGWSVYDNGKKIKIKKNWNNFMAFKLEDSDKHDIELVYRPVGFYIGVMITCISGVLLLIFELLSYKRRKIINMSN